ncbi:MAG: cysteine--tRNA ligase [Chlamydiae bacterium]|nr:cysteine--tRNA ligase [Chlamydiota bacterium]
MVELTNKVSILRLYDTESRTQKEVHPSQGNEITLYTCGPTVYNFAHIGNFRTYIFEDLLRRTMQLLGMRVKQVMNLTDVDDKTIKGALQQDQTLAEYTKPYIEAFFSDLSTLGIEPVEFYPSATEYIPDMICMIEELLKKNIAYVGDEGSVYFRIAAFPSYGRLSHLRVEDLQQGASKRVGDEYDKDEACDFVLWKAYDPTRDGNIFWESPFGKGRPGWHIECSAMAVQLLGETIDIHVGGVDNMFPHHENEIAQCEACTGKRFVRHWLHAEHLLVDHKKMSKSLGNFYTLRDLLQKGYTGQQIRYALLQTHYRTQLNFTFEVLEAAKASIRRILDCKERLESITQEEGFGVLFGIVASLRDKFVEALCDDLNISLALSVLFDAIREIHSLCDQGKVSHQEASQALSVLHELDQVLGLFSLTPAEEIPVPLLEALDRRQKARLEKDWKEADRCRDFILSHGYKIEDSPQGPRLKKS